jgi:hypothetical protein
MVTAKAIINMTMNAAATLGKTRGVAGNCTVIRV